jgi:predicted dehydrogenase/threonine dehydrogenase-like Zn-dependent dehydrogenase
MKQLLQNARTGEIAVAELPAPQLLPGCVLVRTASSVVSPGTERAAAEFAEKSLLGKARARPDLVRDVLAKVRRDGLLPAWESARGRLDQPVSLGYSSAGTVIGVGEGVSGVQVGDRVACAGANYAAHAEIVCVPRLLMALVPPVSSVLFEEAAFTTLGAVALHGIRTGEVKLGDNVAVIGLGLMGQLTVQLLKAAGARVFGMDIQPQRAELALQSGTIGACASAEEFRDLCLQSSGGNGVDAAIITAETPSSDPVNLAGEISRDRGIVVAVGTVGMDLQRRRYYEKELDFRVSRSYGPGRYDAAYEQGGRDYPIGYVRWTETRNMAAFLDLLANGKLNVGALITHRFPIAHAQQAYELISRSGAAASLGVVLTYEPDSEYRQRVDLAAPAQAVAPPQQVSVGLLGAGNFATTVLLPAIKRRGAVEFRGICAATGVHSGQAAEKLGFQYCTTDEAEVLGDPRVNTVIIATRHHLHASQTIAALAAGKHVFCEKPLCLTREELQEVVSAYAAAPHLKVMVDFNRRFSPMAVRLKEFLSQVHEPLALHYRVNAGPLSQDHWIYDPQQGGGRIIGEVCHFVDLLRFLAAAPATEVEAEAISGGGQAQLDNVVASLHFANGSHGTISYLSNGDRGFPKERLEVFGGGISAALDDFRKLEMVRHGKTQVVRSRWRQDKGHAAAWSAFAASIEPGSANPIRFEEIVGTTLATLAVVESASAGKPVKIDAAAFMRETLFTQS